MVLLETAPKVTKIFGLLLWDNLLPKCCQNRPIWSHGLLPVQKVQREGEGEPDADEGELLDRVGQKVVDDFDSWKDRIKVEASLKKSLDKPETLSY